jgi:hypothetical protein
MKQIPAAEYLKAQKRKGKELFYIIWRVKINQNSPAGFGGE